MRTAGDGRHGRRLRALTVILWRAGLRIHEALALSEADLHARRGSLLVRRGKGGRRREVGMDDWAWEQLQPWLEVRVALPVGPLLCVLSGPTCGRAWSASAARTQLRETAAAAGVRRRFAPHQLASRIRGRDGPRRRAADRHPTSTRAQQPRDHLDLPAGHRQRRDHRHGPRAPRADGVRQRIAQVLSRAAAHRPLRQLGWVLALAVASSD